MLQQTQVARVLVKYPQFVKSFPNMRALATAPLSKILKVWQGMGYNRRAVSLKHTAQIVVERFGGKVPDDPNVLATLPGIGPATAGAIATYAWNKPVTFVETNIRRAIIHHFYPRRRRVPEHEVWKLATKTSSRKNPRKWCWALMDYGTSLPRTIGTNPNTSSERYRRQSPFKGSKREIRGKVVTLLLRSPRGRLTLISLRSQLANGSILPNKDHLTQLLAELAQDGIISMNWKNGTVALAQ